jgi:hypothetical protein
MRTRVRGMNVVRKVSDCSAPEMFCSEVARVALVSIQPLFKGSRAADGVHDVVMSRSTVDR